MNITPLILCGGSGTRLWPLSRTHYPKQFLPLLGNGSLFQATLNRANQLPNCQKTILIANESHRFLVAEQLQQSQIKADLLLEPSARNTAPAIAAAAFHIQATLPAESSTLLLILPSDHLIADDQSFRQAVANAIPHAEAGKLVTFGIPATRPETGYGYIEVGTPLEQAHLIRRFVEKPDFKTACTFVESGKYLWNSGMFLIRADVYLDALKTYSPAIYEASEKAVTHAVRDLDFIRLDAEAFNASPADSIDYAIMEKTPNGAVVTLDAGWSDIGSWDALAATQPVDESGNTLQGDIVAIDTKNTYLHSERQLLTTVGIQNLIIVTTTDAVLVADKSQSQAVKEIVAQLKTESRQEADFHTTVHRPWGSYEGIDRGPRYQVKRIHVKPGASLSLQMHYHRAEHWIVVKGTAKVICGDEERFITENQSTFIPLGTKHRLENPGRVELELIEVQSGSYLGEDDIVRLEDHYGR